MNVLIDLAAHPVIAHRGNSAHAPENTFESFDQAIALGVDALEFDVRLTRDGRVVVVHDATLDRTTSGTGLVAAHTFDEIRAVDAGARFSPDGGRTTPYRQRGCVIPLLEEMLERYPRIPLLIEVKVPEAVAPTLQLLERYGAVSRTLVDSTNPSAVEPFRGGALATGASFRDVIGLLQQAWRRKLRDALPYQALCIPRWYYGVPVPVFRLARLAATAGTLTHIWTVNDVQIAEALWRGGINGIITDDPASMVALRQRVFGEQKA